MPRQVALRKAQRATTASALDGTLAGTWDFVTGWITFPYQFESGGGTYYLLARGYPADSLGGEGYGIEGWDGKVFWAELGDGIPHLISAQLLDPNYVPAASDGLTKSGRLYISQYAVYRQAGGAYPAAQYPDGGAPADLLFVTDANDQVIEVAVDVLSADGSTLVETRQLQAGDAIQLWVQAAELADPGVIWLVGYMDFQTLNGEPNIAKGNHLPNTDFTDPYLQANAAQFDAGSLPLYLLLDGASETGPTWGYSEPVALGYTWGEAKTRFADSASAGNTSTATGGTGAFGWALLMALGGIAVGSGRRKR